MINKRQKGNMLQNKVAQFYEAQGYSVHNQKSIAKQIRPGLWISQRNDILGAYDIIATNFQEIKFIQVTADTNIKNKLEKIIQVKLPLDKSIVEVWQYLKNGEFKILKYDGEKLTEYARYKRKKLYLLNLLTK